MGNRGQPSSGGAVAEVIHNWTVIHSPSSRRWRRAVCGRNASVMPELRGPFRGSEAIRAGLVTRDALRGPRFQKLGVDVFQSADVPANLAKRSRGVALKLCTTATGGSWLGWTWPTRGYGSRLSTTGGSPAAVAAGGGCAPGQPAGRMRLVATALHLYRRVRTPGRDGRAGRTFHRAPFPPAVAVSAGSTAGSAGHACLEQWREWVPGKEEQLEGALLCRHQSTTTCARR